MKPEPPLDKTKAQLRREFGFDTDQFVVGTIGRFDPIKNFPLLIHSLAQASQTLPQLRALLIGNGPVFKEVRQLIGELGLANRILLTGYRDDAKKLIKCLDLFVLSSFSEGTSMALLESIAAGVPVVVTAVGGNPEIVLKEQTGWVVPSDSTEELTTAIVDAAVNSAKGQYFSVAAKHRFEDHFTFAKMIERYDALYQSMLSVQAQAAPYGA
ncbi:MAG: glycosyltransferase [Gammaproteobacteria bacterium]